jgi:hypothetical protein
LPKLSPKHAGDGPEGEIWGKKNRLFGTIGVQSQFAGLIHYASCPVAAEFLREKHFSID